MKRTLIIHPFFLIFYVILFPLSQNIGIVGWEAVRSLFFALVGVIIVLNVLRFIIKSPQKASLLASGFILLMFSYGHIQTLLSSWGAKIVPFFLIPLWLLLFCGWVYWVLWKLPNPDGLVNYLNVFSFVLLIFPVSTILTYIKQSTEVDSRIVEFQQELWKDGGVATLVPEIVQRESRQPDIYYIILDAYTRADILSELFDYDNTPFIQALESRGFYVARQSRSNYADTAYSLASSLNLVQIETLPSFIQETGNTNNTEIFRQTAGTLVQTNRVAAFLREQGYTFITFDSGYEELNIKSSDHYLQHPDIGGFDVQNAFEMMLLDSSIGQVYLDLMGENFTPMQSLFDDHRTRILFTFENLPDFTQSDTPIFIYAHVLSPHAPYVFGPNGETVRGVDPFTLLEVQGTVGEWRPEMYSNQVNNINRLVLDTIDLILANSDPDPIIIIQGDHSSRVSDEQNPSDELRMKILFPILNAYHLPDNGKNLLYPSITPVNTFRIVFDHYFGTHLPLVDDISYLLESGDQGLNFIDACIKYDACK